MTDQTDRDNTHDDPASPASTDAVPEIEDAYEAESVGEESPLEDDPAAIDPTARILAADNGEGAGAVALDEAAPRLGADGDAGDAAAIDENEELQHAAVEPSSDEDRPSPIRALELSSHRIGVELKRIESRVRELLESRDPKRKRKLSGTARWQELEEDLLALRFSGRVDEGVLAEVRQLITRRHYLFSQLRFMAGTRPTWNT